MTKRLFSDRGESAIQFVALLLLIAVSLVPSVRELSEKMDATIRLAGGSTVTTADIQDATEYPDGPFVCDGFCAPPDLDSQGLGTP